MLAEKKIFAYKCKKCGKAYYPKHSRCFKCKSKDFDEIELGNVCTLLTYTKLYAIPKGIDKVPLVLGIVEFENGVRVLGQITTEEVEIGMKLKPISGELRVIEGKPTLGFKFEPLKIT
ncbi:MAG: Zn-ribbon domain-containing OB-fold protein [Candidatus Bathyarchaeia archaeon]